MWASTRKKHSRSQSLFLVLYNIFNLFPGFTAVIVFSRLIAYFFENKFIML